MSREVKIFLGYSFGRGNPQPWHFFSIPNLMVNAFDIAERNIPISLIHETLNYKGNVFCDSGGWQIIQRSLNLDIFEIISIQKNLGADLCAVLDNGLDEKQHLKNLKIYSEHADFNFVPVIPIDISERGVEEILKIIDAPQMIAIGKMVPILQSPLNFTQLKIAIKKIIEIKQKFPESRLHIFGLGGIYTALISFLIIDSVDTTSWIHDARYSKIRLLGGGIYSTHPVPNRKFIGEKLNSNNTILKDHSWIDLDKKGVEGMRIRAIHNAWVLTQEEKIINEAINDGHYTSFLKERIQQSYFHKVMFNSVKECLEKRGIQC